MSASGPAAKIEFSGDAKSVLDATGKMVVAFDRVEKQLKKMGEEADKAKKKTREALPVKEAEDYAKSLNKGAESLLKQSLTAAALLQTLLAIAEATDRGVKSQYAFADAAAQTATKIGGSHIIGKIRSDTSAFAKSTGTTWQNSLQQLEAARLANPSLSAEEILEQVQGAGGSGRWADEIKIKDAEANSFAATTARVRKYNPKMSADDAAARALVLNKAGVSGDAAESYLAQFKNTDTGIALAQAAEAEGFAASDISIAMGKIVAAQSGGADAKFLPAGSRRAAPEDVLVRLLSGDPKAGKFFDESMTKGNKGAAFKRMDVRPFLNQGAAWRAEIEKIRTDYANDPITAAGEIDEQLRETRVMNEAERAGETAREYARAKAEGIAAAEKSNFGSTVSTLPLAGGLLQSAAAAARTAFDAMSVPDAPVDPRLMDPAYEVSEAAKWRRGPKGPYRVESPPPPPPPQVRVATPPGVVVDVRIRNASEAPTRSAL